MTCATIDIYKFCVLVTFYNISSEHTTDSPMNVNKLKSKPFKWTASSHLIDYYVCYFR